jgi:hypothetical protein
MVKTVGSLASGNERMERSEVDTRNGRSQTQSMHRKLKEERTVMDRV